MFRRLSFLKISVGIEALPSDIAIKLNYVGLLLKYRKNTISRASCNTIMIILDMKWVILNQLLVIANVLYKQKITLTSMFIHTINP